MHSKILFFIISLLTCTIVFSSTNDSISIRGCFIMKDMQINNSKGLLYQFKTKKQLLSFDIEKGNFDFKLPLTIEPGVYRLQYCEGLNRSHTDLIIDGKERKIRFQLKFMNDNYPIFLESIENQKWYNYLKVSHTRIERLNSLFDYLSKFFRPIFRKTNFKNISKRKAQLL